MDKDNVGRSWRWFLALGAILIVAGCAIVATPFVSTIVIERLIGWVLLIVGGYGLVQMFRTGTDWDAKVTYFALGGLNILGGLFLLFRPLEGLVALTLVMLTVSLVTGLVRIVAGIQSRPEEGSGLVILSGCLSVAITFWLFWIYPEVSAVLLGVFIGVSMVGEGAGYIRLAYGKKHSLSDYA